MKVIITVSILLTTIVVISCSKKNMASKSKPAPLTYSANVKSIIQAKCAPCHIPAEGGKKAALDNYAAVRSNLDSIIRRIQLLPTQRGFMPFRKEALPAEEIAVIKKWKEDGAGE